MVVACGHTGDVRCGSGCTNAVYISVMPWLAYRLRGRRGPGQVVLSSMRIFIPLITVVAFLWLMVW
jgi:hypothetical protein